MLDLFSSRKTFTYEEERAYIIKTLGDFLKDTGGTWDWDNFISISTGYPKLEAVRGACLELKRILAELETDEIAHRA